MLYKEIYFLDQTIGSMGRTLFDEFLKRVPPKSALYNELKSREYQVTDD